MMMPVPQAKDLKQRNSLLLIGCARGLLPDVRARCCPPRLLLGLRNEPL